MVTLCARRPRTRIKPRFRGLCAIGYGNGIQAWIPFPYPIAQRPRNLGFIRVLGRLAHNVTIPQAQAELDGIARDLRAEFPEFSEQQLGLQAIPLQADAVKETRLPLLALFGGVGFVLLLSCANVANLLLASASERTSEM